jgi:hypothetical protein
MGNFWENEWEDSTIILDEMGYELQHGLISAVASKSQQLRPDRATIIVI